MYPQARWTKLRKNRRRISSHNGLSPGVGHHVLEVHAVANSDFIADDGLSYCTWNGLGQNLNEEKVLKALESLSKHNINITGLIIDDNWQSLVSLMHPHSEV